MYTAITAASKQIDRYIEYVNKCVDAKEMPLKFEDWKRYDN